MRENVIRVAVSGAAGRMGREVVKAVQTADGLQLVAAIDHHGIGADIGPLAGIGATGVIVGDDLEAELTRHKPDVLVDFTLPDSVLANLRTALTLGVSPVVGTTGLSQQDLADLDAIARAQGVGAFVAPNFALGAVLLMQFAAQAARYLPDVEIIELHHDRKLDSPSGTALLTAQKIAAAREEANVAPLTVPTGLVEKAPGARGARDSVTGDVPIHSVRLPGFVAHQEVIFGRTGAGAHAAPRLHRSRLLHARRRARRPQSARSHWPGRRPGKPAVAPMSTPTARPGSSPTTYLRDILAPDLDVIFVGAAASHNSARAGHWYAGPTNKFWLLLAQAGFTPRQLRPEEDAEVLQYGLGLTCVFPHLATSANHLLPAPSAERRRQLHEKLLRFRPRFLCFNGKDVYQMCTGRLCTDWGEQVERIGDSRVFVVHSSSARADHWGAERLALYRELYLLVHPTVGPAEGYS